MIFPHLLCCKVCPRRYPKGLISLLATSDRSSEVIIVPDTVKSFSDILYFFSECNFHFFLHWSFSDTFLSSDWVLGPAHSYTVCTYETRYWAQHFPMQFEHTRQLAPTTIFNTLLNLLYLIWIIKWIYYKWRQFSSYQNLNFILRYY